MSREQSLDEGAARPAGRQPSAEFVRQVRDALRNLHDRTRLQTHPLTRFASPQADKRAPGRGKRLQDDLLQAIEALRPDPQIPADSSAARSYLLLAGRYVEGQETTEVQRQLAIAKTEYYADHQRALDAVASVLWERWQPENTEETTPRPARPDHEPAAPSPDVPRTVSSHANRRRHNLPAQLTSFVGRGAEIADVTNLVAAHRLVTLTGTGGCGKTRLALQVAGPLVDAFADGVWLVELAPLGDPVLLAQTIARTLGVQEESGRPILRTLLDFLGPRRVLLLVDNCEHLITACAHLIEAILQAGPNVTVLATSREALGLPGEVAWRVPSLTLPDEDQRTDAMRFGGGAGVFEAVQLFVDRARMADPRFELMPANAPAIAQICRRLDGIPLALELAAARLTVLRVEQIAARLDDRFRLLTGGSRTALPRQQTLRATLDWSYALLTEAERRVLRRLAVFASGCTLEAAEAVCSGGGVAPAQVLDLLSQLVGKSLVVVDMAASEPRYRLLETIRQYGRDRLGEAEEAHEVRERHFAWFLALAERAEPELIGPRQRDWLDRLEGEIDNLREALDWSMGRPPAEHPLRLAAALGWLWEARDYWTEGRDRLRRALDLPENAARTSVRVRALEFFGNITWILDGQEALVTAVCEECLAIAREIGDLRREIEAAGGLAISALIRRDLETGKQTLVDVLTQARASGDRWSIARVLDGLALVAYESRDTATSRELLVESEEHYRAVGDWRALGMVLLLLGKVVAEQGDLPMARALLAESLELYRDLRMRARVILILGQLGVATWLDNDPVRAETLLREGEALARDSGLRSLIYHALIARAFIARADGIMALAHDLATEAWKVTAVSERGQNLEDSELSLRGLLAIDRGDDLRGVRLLGAAARWSLRWFSLLGEDVARDEALAVARARLGDEATAVAYTEGQAMTLEQVIKYAREEEPGN